MRATPMAVFTSLCDDESAKAAIEADVSMTHSNQTVKDIVYLYCIAIHHLINNPHNENRAEEAFNIAYKKSDGMDEYVCSRSGKKNSPTIWL